MLNVYQQNKLGFAFIVTIGSLVLSVMVGLFIKSYQYLPTIFGRLDGVCGCVSYLTFGNNPYISSLIVFVTLSIVLALIFAGYKMLKVVIGTNRFVRYNLKSKKSVVSDKLQNIVLELGIKHKIIEFESTDMEAFCFGWLGSKIAISSAMVDDLSRSELKSVLLHEQYHVKNHEPQKLLIVRFLDKLLFFVPGYHRSTQQYILLSELSADNYSNNILKTNSYLVGALYAVVSHRRNALENQLAVSYFGTLTSDRIDGLSRARKVNIVSPVLISGLALFFIFSYGFNTLALSSEVPDSSQSQVCYGDVLQTQASECQMMADQLSKCKEGN